MSEKGYNSIYMKDRCQEEKALCTVGESVFLVKTGSAIQGGSDRHNSIQPITWKIVLE